MPRILHLGLGAFHRAHQAWYLHRLRESGDPRWTLAAGNLRPDQAETLAALQAQQGRYTLETVSPDGERRHETIRAIAQVLPHEPGHAALVALAADPATRIVSFTVTEAGYHLDPQGRLDLAAPEIAADLQAARDRQPCTTIHGVLATMLRERMRRAAGPVTLLNCDNLRHNGDRSRDALARFVDALDDPALRDWIARHAAFPNSMVDRITPRPPPDLAQRVAAATGWRDAAPVMAERFAQWVIEDRFAAGRPAWETVGVQMVDSVDPYEEAKIRVLNGTHCTIAWAGTLAGHRFIHEGVQDPAIQPLARAYVADVIPMLEPSPIDLPAYRDAVLQRFANPAILDTNQRVAMDGFSKLPGFIAPTVHDRLARGLPLSGVAAPAALFLAYLQRWRRGELPHAYDDQAMDPAAARAICDAGDPVAALCANAVLWGAAAGDARLVAAVREADARIATVAARRDNPPVATT